MIWKMEMIKRRKLVQCWVHDMGIMPSISNLFLSFDCWDISCHVITGTFPVVWLMRHFNDISCRGYWDISCHVITETFPVMWLMRHFLSCDYWDISCHVITETLLRHFLSCDYWDISCHVLIKVFPNMWLMGYVSYHVVLVSHKSSNGQVQKKWSPSVTSYCTVDFRLQLHLCPRYIWCFRCVRHSAFWKNLIRRFLM